MKLLGNEKKTKKTNETSLYENFYTAWSME